MNLLAEYAPKIELALARMAVGEKVGWSLDRSTARTRTDDGGQGTVVIYQLTLFTPAPVLGRIINWTIPFVDPFSPLANDAALLNEELSKALDGMRNLASQLLKG